MNLEGCVGLEVRKKPERTLRSLMTHVIYHSETTSLPRCGTGLRKIRDAVGPRETYPYIKP